MLCSVRLLRVFIHHLTCKLHGISRSESMTKYPGCSRTKEWRFPVMWLGRCGVCCSNPEIEKIVETCYNLFKGYVQKPSNSLCFFKKIKSLAPGTQVRCWTEVFPQSVTFKNAYKVRKLVDDVDQTPVPHSFTFMLRSGQSMCKQ